MYIALVDTMSTAEFLDCVKTSLSAALEGLPPSALFGLISFDDTVSKVVYLCHDPCV